MKLVLSVISEMGGALDDFTLNQESATIGRAQDNSVVLEDAKRYISSHHALIDYRRPDYYVTDTSTNGVIVNDATQPLGNGNSIRLSDGDQLHIGDYTLSVSLIQVNDTNTDIPIKPISSDQFHFDDDPFADFNKDSVQEMIDDNQLGPEGWGNSDDQVKNGFDFLEEEKDTSNTPSPEASDVDQPPAYKEAFEGFHGKSEPVKAEPDDIFGEDWFTKEQEASHAQDKDPFGQDFFAEETKKASQQETASPSQDQEILKEKESPHPIPKPAQPGNNKESVVTDAAFEQVVAQFLRGAGLEDSGIQQTITPESFYIIGKILRASVQGTLDVLIGRAKIKNEMHLDVTMIRSRKNNPIKFSVSSEEALKKLLAPEDAGYLPAEEAIEEAFDDIKAHQFSVIAGMQTALLEVLKRFDPNKLEQRLQQESPISANIPIHKQAKLWHLFEHLYDDIEHEAEDNFYHLFGQAFAETYQQQINKLKSVKKETPY